MADTGIPTDLEQFVLHRKDPEGLIIISQPAHAWLSGQLARNWGNDLVGPVEPAQEVWAAAEQHAIGWQEWETNPTLNSDDGLPHTFFDLPTSPHLKIWSPAGERALASYGRYVALLISMHGTGLYQRFHDYDQDTPAEAEAARNYVAKGREFEAHLLQQLRADPRYSRYATPEFIERNRRLIGVWDGMSLAIAGGLHAERRFENVPARQEDLSLTFRPLNSDGTEISVEPWPFQVQVVNLYCEGRRLTGTFDDEEAMRRAIGSAPWVTLDFQLRPA